MRTRPAWLTIGIDARAATEVPAGRGRVVRELLRALGERGRATGTATCSTRASAGGAAELDERFRWRLIAAGDPWWHLRAARAANAECDVLPVLELLPDRRGSCGSRRCRSSTTWSPSSRRCAPNRRSALIERATLGPRCGAPRRLLAISQATARRARRALPARGRRARSWRRSASRRRSPRPTPRRPAALPPPGFVLAVGDARAAQEPAAAGRGLPRADRGAPGRASAGRGRGRVGWETGETLDALRSLGERARLLGYVSDAALAELYRRCAVFCYPSLGEGFGLPVLEAMAAGAPVLTSNVSSLPEVGGDAVAYADPRDVAAIAAGLDDAAGARPSAGRSWPAAGAPPGRPSSHGDRSPTRARRGARRTAGRGR